ncbi:hypothetical protein GOALK_038_00970 [Gordonia alkanivorans NBRC 16433]|uniref:Uncharacterized protein n=1 Tax=Gordonia alkanivorans NBRC 16433 TaxID=1027371 RepID=F9VT06_9ACTN|nr:hypothetical protein GOALK_038_00970 [Gordonia alkanivorans NBRC 16433]
MTRSPLSQISRSSRSDSMYSSPVIGLEAKFSVRFASLSAATFTFERSTIVASVVSVSGAMSVAVMVILTSVVRQ